MAAAVTLLFFLSYLPWLISDRKKIKKKAQDGAGGKEVTEENA
jgi:hypothetical protein